LPVSKVGISAEPVARFDQLQATNWSELYLFGVIWFPSKGAGKAETAVLRAAKEMECHLRGEWLSLDANETFELALKACRFLNLSACDAKTWVSNWRSRIEGTGRAMSNPLERRTGRALYPAA